MACQNTPLMTRLAVLVVSVGLLLKLVTASEFPERECCDPVYPLPAVSASVTPDPPPSPSISSSVTRPGQMKSIETLNCLVARQLCFEDPSCSPILETIPRVCGAEIVSCSTVTVTKCQAALRTLQAFPFFKPTCLCKEPLLDQECNSFRNFLFDHPCIFVHKKEKDPYPIDALPTCNHALVVCQKDKVCMQSYEDFKTKCKVRDGKCQMEDRDACHEAWTNIRFSPMFGCICPNNHMKKRCDRIFSLVNHNPCIVKEISKETHSPFEGAHIGNPLLGSIKESYDQSQDLYGRSFAYGSSLFTMTRPTSVAADLGRSSSLGPKSEENSSVTFQSTCNQALVLCKQNMVCRKALTPVLQFCNTVTCKRQNCMEALQNFYRSIDIMWSLEIAFCLCKKTKNNQDECLVAQEMLHPVCAQQVEGPVIPTCHSLAEVCREDLTCRSRLENYEQSCAVDSITKQCAGPPSECRKAMLGILGTALRSNCACKGTEISQLYDCMGWQRVLWFNPCVVESQRDFHSKKQKGLNLPKAASSGSDLITTLRTTAMPSSLVTMLTTVIVVTTQATRQHSTKTVTPTTSTTIASTSISTHPHIIVTTTPSKMVTTSTATTSAATIQPPPPQSTTRATSGPPPPTTTTTTTTVATVGTTTPLPQTTVPPTTRPPPTESTIPPRFCVVQRPKQMDQYILEKEGKRLYRDEEPDCSEVCQCGEGEVLVCNTICVQRAPCKTDFAFYNHAAPAYQAYRGRCLCYSGRFICMRPPPDQYSLPQGVFLFLGYSETDEMLLKPLLSFEVQDAVNHLQGLLLHLRPKSLCVLSLQTIIVENIILVAKLNDTNSSLTKNLQQQSTFSVLLKEKEECVSVLQEISERINSHDSLVHSHLLLSIFKMAEVEVVYPVSSSCSQLVFKYSTILSLNLVLVTFSSLSSTVIVSLS